MVVADVDVVCPRSHCSLVRSIPSEWNETQGGDNMVKKARGGEPMMTIA